MNGVVKSYCGFNHYVIRDSMINRLVITDKYSMYPEIETWQHVIIYKKNDDIRFECIINLKKELIKIELYHKDSKKIEIMVNNIEAFLNQ